MTLKVVSAAMILFVSTVIAEARTVYQAHDSNFMWNNFCVLNNQWGKEKALNADWYQRVVLEDDNTISFEYKWDSNNYNIMGYPAFIAGWHWGTFLGSRAPKGTFGLPARVGDNPAFMVSINYRTRMKALIRNILTWHGISGWGQATILRNQAAK